MKMELGLDTGPMIAKVSTQISASDTTASLTKRLAEMGGKLLCQTLEHPNDLICEPQPTDGVTYAEKLLKSESRIRWQENAYAIERRLRAFTPFQAFTSIKTIWPSNFGPQKPCQTTTAQHLAPCLIPKALLRWPVATALSR